MSNQLTVKKIKEIIAAQKPGVEVDDEVLKEVFEMANDSNVKGQAPDLEFLIRKFFDGKRQKRASQDPRKVTNTSRIIRVKPSGSKPTDAVGTGQRKVIVVSAKDESIVAEQG